MGTYLTVSGGHLAIVVSFTFELFTLPEQVKCLLETDYRTDLLFWRGLAGGMEVAKSQTRLSDFTSTFHLHAWRRKWQPTPVFLPGESQEPGSLVGCRLWGRTESDTTEAT